VKKWLRVDMSALEVRQEQPAEKYAGKGGRWLTSQFINEEVDPGCHPLGENNKLIFAPGFVTGTSAPSSGRISAGGKSPLTGGIKESNAGTPFAQSLARLGYQALILEGLPADKEQRYVLRVNSEGGELISAPELKGLGMYDTITRLREQYGDVDICGTGPAGEMKMAMAGICYNDPEYRASRYSGRGGLGATMGSKGVKAIVIERDGPGVEMADSDLFKIGQRKLAEALRNHDVTKPGGALNSFGTAVLINILNQAGGLPFRNFRSGVFDEAEAIAGETIADEVKKRGGEGMMGHSCSPGCVIRCSNVWPRKDGTEHVSCIEYESDWSLGANLDIDDLDAIAEMIYICNDLGLDTIEAGVTLGVAMEGGLAEFGDSEKAIDLLREVGRGTPLGRIIGNGAGLTGKALGVTRVPVVKNQGMPAYEPRSVKGIGVTYITSTMGADHTAGYTIAPEILSVGGESDPLDPQGKVELSRDFQATTAFVDSSGYCLFITFALLDSESGFEGMLETVNGVLGTSYTGDDVLDIGKKILKMERKFNEAAGLTRADDRIPEFMRREKLPPHDRVFEITDDELDQLWDF